MRTRKSSWNTKVGESLLDVHSTTILSMFRKGDSLNKIGNTIGFRASTVRKWLLSRGEYDRLVVCALPSCGKEFSFRPRKLFCCQEHTKIGVTHRNRKSSEGQQKDKARNAIKRALKTGRLVKPDACSRCHQAEQFASDGRSLLQADHHNGYDDDHLIDIVWICHKCDREIEAVRKGRSMNHSKEAKSDRKKNRKRITLTVDGETKFLTEWAALTGISYETLFARVCNGWADDDVVRTPVMRLDIH